MGHFLRIDKPALYEFVQRLPDRCRLASDVLFHQPPTDDALEGVHGVRMFHEVREDFTAYL